MALGMGSKPRHVYLGSNYIVEAVNDLMLLMLMSSTVINLECPAFVI